MATVGEAKPGPLKILMFGPSGTGKTLLALTCGAVAQIFDLDMGVESALGKARLNRDAFSDERLLVQHIPIPEPTPTVTAVAYEKVLQFLIGISNDLAKPIDQQVYKPKVLIIDSFTLLCDAAMRYVLRNNGRLNRPVTTRDGNIQLQEWGLMIMEIEKIVLLLRGLPIHVILIAHSEPLMNQMDQVMKYQLAVPTRRLPPRIPAYFDELWFLEVNDLGNRKERVLRTEASAMFDAKSRAGLADKTDVNLGMKEIFKRLGREL